MKFNHELIENPVIVDNNTVQGTFQGKTVRVSRRLDGWSVRLSVYIDEILLHDDNATQDNKAAFEQLETRAWNDKAKSDESKRESLRPLIRELFGIG